VSMPEYQLSMKGVDAIKEYYRELLSRRKTKDFTKKILELIVLKGNVAEIGTFTTTYTNGNNIQTTLDGKYFNIWSVKENGSLKLKAESYGYFKAIDTPSSHVVKVANQGAGRITIQPTMLNKNLAFQLQALNALMEKSVKNRDGNLRADFFTEDAVFMPYADSLKKGMPAIRSHLIAYNSYPVTIDSISIYNVYVEDCSEFVIEYPMFYVEWHIPGHSGIGSGKGIRIWRREADCSLKLFREIGVHDHLE